MDFFLNLFQYSVEQENTQDVINEKTVLGEQKEIQEVKMRMLLMKNL